MQVDALKSRLSTIVSAVAVPSLLQPGHHLAPASSSGRGGAAQAAGAAADRPAAARAAQAHADLRSALEEALREATGGGGGASQQQARGPWSRLVSGEGGAGAVPRGASSASDPFGSGSSGGGGAAEAEADSALRGAVSRAQSEAQALVGRLGQLEVWHWELGRGIAGVEAARRHLGGLCGELQSGRPSIALVLGQEMLALMDAPTSSGGPSSSFRASAALPSSALALPPSSGNNSAAAAAGPPGAFVDLSKLSADLAGARQALMEAAAAAKTSEAMLSGLVEAIPTWIELVQVRGEGKGVRLCGRGEGDW